jgi:ABC-2 type transport system ATP-binding protein
MPLLSVCVEGTATTLLPSPVATELPVARRELGVPVISAEDVARSFRDVQALAGVSLTVRAGEIHALLGPNGAGKTTLLRVLTGLVDPSAGSVRILGLDTAGAPRALRGAIGLVPASDRSFYLRISGLENLAFFARLHGLRRRAAFERARELLADVGLEEAGRRRAGEYSHGMLKRLAIARALISDPRILLVDEATHDLDPVGALAVRELVGATAAKGTAVIWATQRLDEIRGFANRVTLLMHGRAAFQGTVPGLLERAVPRRYLIRLRNGSLVGADLERAARRALGPVAAIGPAGEDSEQYLLDLAEAAVVGDAIAALTSAQIRVLSCSHERSEVEDAFLSVTRSGDAR